MKASKRKLSLKSRLIKCVWFGYVYKINEQRKKGLGGLEGP